MAKRGSLKRSDKIAEIVREIPGYDPYATADDAWFDAEAAQRAIEFFPACLKHVEGAVAGQPFVLERWEKAILGNLAGWKRKDGHGRIVRRYRKALVYVPRKNGKTPLIAGFANYILFCDEEAGQQNYIASAAKHEAYKCFRHIKGMIDREPELSSRCSIFGGRAAAAAGFCGSIVRDDGSFLQVISADAHTQHGGNTHLAVYDELHAAPNPDLYDVLNTSMASDNRPQPLFLMITTADFERPSVCNEVHDYACKVRDGLIDDPRFLPVIYEATKEDDWTDPEVWQRVNPNLGVSVSREYLASECEIAKRNPRVANTFKRLHLNLQTQQDVAWLDMDHWASCAAPPPAIADDQDTFGGLDLSSTLDLAAWVIVIPPPDPAGIWGVIPHFFLPQATIDDRGREQDFLYKTWREKGLLFATPGNVIDYEFIRAQIVKDVQELHVKEVGFDPWNATQLAVRLQENDGIACTEVRQGFASLSAPSKFLETLVLSDRLAHGGNEVLTWCAGNVQVRTDPAGNIKPVKPAHKSKAKIDGIVALITGMSRAIVDPRAGQPQILMM